MSGKERCCHLLQIKPVPEPGQILKIFQFMSELCSNSRDLPSMRPKTNIAPEKRRLQVARLLSSTLLWDDDSFGGL